MDSNTVKKIGRKKASSWGRPHKGKRTTANRATRTILKRALKKLVD